MEYSYSEFKTLVFLNKKLPVSFVVDNVDNDRYYKLEASEFITGTKYTCIFNNIDHPDWVIDFERNYITDCNRILTGYDNHEQNDILNEILNELRLLNAMMKHLTDCTVTMDDVLSEKGL